MDRLEKAERLRQAANVSFEEAKAALDACGDDLLDAMVYLEKQGKAKKPEQSSYSTEYEQQPEYTPVQETVNRQESAATSFGRTIGRGIRTIVKFVRSTSFEISRKGKTIFTMPSWVMLLIVLFSWHVSLPALVIALFFGFRYSFHGEADHMQKANDILERAGSFADEMEGGLKGQENSRKTEEDNVTREEPQMFQQGGEIK